MAGSTVLVLLAGSREKLKRPECIVNKSWKVSMGNHDGKLEKRQPTLYNNGKLEKRLFEIM